MKQYHIEVGKLMTSARLGLLTKPMCKMKTLIGLLIKKYFMHGHRITWD
jgi:hypothetical protein